MSKEKKKPNIRVERLSVTELVGKKVKVWFDFPGVKNGKLKIVDVDLNLGTVALKSKSRTLIAPIDRTLIELL